MTKKLEVVLAVMTAAALVLTAAAGCGGSGNNAPTSSPGTSTCTPGEVQSCACPDGGEGNQSCDQDGSWGLCESCGTGGGVDADFTLDVSSQSNALHWNGSCAAKPATMELDPGSYTMTLVSSSLSKGSAAVDNYVLVHIPFASDHEQYNYRYTSLNGVNDSFQFDLEQSRKIRMWFIDSDLAGNAGEAQVEVTPGSHMATISAQENLLQWDKACNSDPANLGSLEPSKSYSVRLAESSLDSAHVLVRLPLEFGNSQEYLRYVVLNGVGDALSFTFEEMDWQEPLRAWYLSDGAISAGTAVLAIDLE
jgi:hypothetical protein